MKETRLSQIERLKDLVEKVDKVSAGFGAPAPGEFLATIMSGYDPRAIDSTLYKLVRKIALREFDGGHPLPTLEEWQMICTIVLDTDDYKQSRVSLDMSIQAAQKLMEYLHSKLKAIELSGALDMRVEVKPLTEEDLDAFKKRFEGDF